MNSQKETKILLLIMTIGYILNFLFGMTGSFFPPESMSQMIIWQFGDTTAIMASILASRYLGARNEGLAAAGFTIMYITYGISFASSSFTAINEEKMSTILLPLVPALFLISFCKIFPKWLRAGSLLVCVPFFFMYQNVIQGTYSYDNLSNTVAYFGIQLLGVLWSVYIFKDYKKQIIQ